jgi:hypothetical protein
MYVSVTGVIVYVMCYRMYPPGYNVGPSAIAAPRLATVVTMKMTRRTLEGARDSRE